MFYKKMIILSIVLSFIAACTPPSNQPLSPAVNPQESAQGSEINEAVAEEVETTPEPIIDEPGIVGSYFTGQGPSTFPIVKETGPVLLHVRVENCNASIILSKKGQNIPYMASRMFATDQFEDQFQYFNEFYGEPEREQTIILDNPTPYEDFDGAPHTEELRIEEISHDCRWEVTLLPLSAAKTISPGEVVTGSHADIFLPSNGLTGLKLRFMNPDHPRMLQHFRGMYAVFADGHVQDLMPEGSDYYEFSIIPSGTQYIEIFSIGYWEIEGS